MELLGTDISVDALVKEVVKDRTYYETSGGGVTASGGEPLAQPDFVAAFLERLRAAGISTALDTCGQAPRRSLEKVLPHADLVMFDLKEIDPGKHRTFTGQGNERILDALRLVRDHISSQAPETRLWVRTPLIPGATATRENLLGLGTFIADNLGDLVERWELCAFNNLCRDKYRRLGMEWQFGETALLAAEDLHAFEEWARRSGVDPSIVLATGTTRDGQEIDRPGES
jgi:pyruvate formate lyase activating enzyme